MAEQLSKQLLLQKTRVDKFWSGIRFVRQNSQQNLRAGMKTPAAGGINFVEMANCESGFLRWTLGRGKLAISEPTPVARG